jgi:hypothetical protein
MMLMMQILVVLSSMYIVQYQLFAWKGLWQEKEWRLVTVFHSPARPSVAPPGCRQERSCQDI